MASRYRPTKEELRARRALVAHYRPEYPNNAPGILAEIKKDPYFKDKPVDLHDIWSDLSFLRRSAGRYLAVEFLPNLASDYMDTVNLMRRVVAESLRRYHEGETETQMREGGHDKNGNPITISTVIHREGGYQWLALAASAQQAILKIAEHGPVTREAHRVMVDYKRLLDLEKKGALAEKPKLAITEQPGQ